MTRLEAKRDVLCCVALCCCVRFMAAMSPPGLLGVVLSPRATPEDMLKAYFLCVVFWEKVSIAGLCSRRHIIARACPRHHLSILCIIVQ